MSDGENTLRAPDLNFIKELIMKCVSAAVRGLAAASLLVAGQAVANINYTFSGVTFSDGGTLTGTFTTNDAINSLLSYNVTTSPGAGGLGFTYTSGTSSSASTALPSIIVLNTPPGLEHILQVTFNPSLLATGSPILPGNNINFASFEQSLTARRDIVSGSAVVATAAVPEPETYALMLAGLGLVGFITHRRKRQGA